MAKRGLGKGLDALFTTTQITETGDQIVSLKLSQIEPNRQQPRKNFDKEKLEILADSIRTHGVIQPIIVKDNNNGFYTIVAGERRWRAARIAGLKEIPAIIRTYDQLSTMEIALIENLQREDLNPIEEALGYKSLLEEFSLTQEKISDRVGKSRSAVANAMRLLTLPESIQALLRNKQLSSGHARAILSVSSEQDQITLSEKIIKDGLNVRQAEALARLMNKRQDKTSRKVEKKSDADLQIDAIRERLSGKLGTKVNIITGAKKGKIEIEYYGDQDLNRLLNLMQL